ncbi:MAG: hypothetical protein J0H91_18925 [Rhodospirillales bacterium]|nr:hypothetical protein [Rhodospirillales bacterium]
MTDPADAYLAPQTWLDKALQECVAARLMAGAKLWAQCFYHAGFALECALKYRIMVANGWNRWPERNERRELYSHNLTELATQAGIIDHLLAAIKDGAPLGQTWLIAKDWSNETRYDPRPFPRRRGEDMLWAVDEMGLVTWLLNL